jgi:hypothetical protein
MNKMQRGELAEFEACFTFACPKVSIFFPFCTAAVLRSRSRAAEIKLPPGAGAEIKNSGSSSDFGSFPFIKDFKKIL